LLVLSFAYRAGTDSADGGYVRAERVERFLAELGYSTAQFDFAVERAVAGALLQPQWTTAIEGRPTAIRVTPAGSYTLKRLVTSFAYVEAIIVDTPVTDPSIRSEIRDVSALPERIGRSEAFIA